MVSDIDGTVVAIQGEAISSASPTDGYILVWSATDACWKPQPQKSLIKTYFSSSGTWTCPAGVTSVILIGSGGGGGGGGGINGVGYGGCGGGGCLQITGFAVVVPGNTYTITVGAGGAGGAGSINGFDGESTTFDTLFTAIGAGHGFSPATWSIGGMCIPDAMGSTNPSGEPNESIACGGIGGNNTNPISTGRYNPNGFNGGSIGSISTCYGGGGGGGGPAGVGANGGNGTNSVGGAGSNAANNTGAGGAGGGGGTTTGGAGGNGGSGYLYVIYVN